MSMVERQIIHLLELNQGLTQMEIAEATGSTRYRVRVTQEAVERTGITLEQAESMNDEELQLFLYPVAPEREGQDFDAARWINRLNESRKLNRMYVWVEEYSPEVLNAGGTPLSYSQFCKRLRSFAKNHSRDLVMPIDRVPGRELFIDWIGDTIEIFDEGENTLKKVYFFVTTLGDSGMPFVEAFTQMTQCVWIQAHLDAFAYYGGLPMLLCPDNTKTAVLEPRLYDPTLNEAYMRLAFHYKVAITPARPYKPRDKGLVENCVGWLETWLLEWLKSRPVYTDLAALNADIRARLGDLCNREYQERAGTRNTVFAMVDKPALRPLPKDSFEYFETLSVIVGKDYHFECEGFQYSVPYKYVGRKLSVHLYPNKVEAWGDGVRIAMHERRFVGNKHVTNPDHMPESHRHRFEFLARDGEYYRERSKQLGDSVYQVVCTQLDAAPLEDQAFRACDGILGLAEKYGVQELGDACTKALSIGRSDYTTILNLLKGRLGSSKAGGKASNKGSGKTSASRENENVRKDWE